MFLPGTFTGFLSLQSHHGVARQSSKKRSPQKCGNCGGEGVQRGVVTRELPMSEVMHSPLPPSKTLEEQAAEILALIEQIISTAPEMEEEEKIPA
jgi:hypothetical protein